MICLAAPRQVRFTCGHSCCCVNCAEDLRDEAAKWARVAADEQKTPLERQSAQAKSVALCPTCREPIGDSVAESGEQVAVAPTFVMPKVRSSGGRGGRGGRGDHPR